MNLPQQAPKMAAMPSNSKCKMQTAMILPVPIAIPEGTHANRNGFVDCGRATCNRPSDVALDAAIQSSIRMEAQSSDRGNAWLTFW
jgi:hypothetical protein